MKAWLTDEEMTMYHLMGYEIIVDDAHIRFTVNGELHREDGPAYMRLVGDGWLSGWYQHGKRHRDAAPATIQPNGTVLWYQHGKKHRDAGPASTHPDGEVVWYQNNKIHRLDGPAFITSDGKMVWYQNGEPHRTDGPAAIYPDGSLDWWMDGDIYETHEDWLAVLKQRGRAS